MYSQCNSITLKHISFTAAETKVMLPTVDGLKQQFHRIVIAYINVSQKQQARLKNHKFPAVVHSDSLNKRTLWHRESTAQCWFMKRASVSNIV